MKQKKKMHKSLKNKIEENEQKLHILLTKGNSQNYKEQYNEDNKENKSYLTNKNQQNNLTNLTLTEINSNINITSNSISFHNNESTYIKNKFEKKNVIKNQKKNIHRNNYGKNNPLIKLSFNLNNFTITPNNTKKLDIKNKPKNRISKDKIKNNNIDKYNESYIKDKTLLENLNAMGMEMGMDEPIKNQLNLNEMFERFEEKEQKKKKKLENLKKQKEINEKKIFTYKPEINKKSKNINKNIKEDFITRQRRYSYIKSEKEEKLKKNILQNEQDKINKNNFLLQKKNKDNSSMGSCGLNTSFISEISCRTKSMANIDTSISKLFEWDEKRKEKIKNLQKEKSKELEKNKHIPKINKKSKSMINRNKKENIFDRLAKEDDVVKAKKKILENLLCPTFQPNINLTFRRFDEDEIEGRANRNKKYNKRKSIDNKDINSMTIRVNRNSNIKPKNKVNNEDICKKENENIENEEICDKFRNLIINNMNKQIRSKSLGNKTNVKKHT